jgi:hypothetical protein
MLKKSRTDKVEPIAAFEKTLNALPIRSKPRRDSAEAISIRSNKLAQEPPLLVARITLSVEPRRMKFRSETDERHHSKSSRLTFPDATTRLKMETFDPMRPYALNDIAEPTRT